MRDVRQHRRAEDQVQVVTDRVLYGIAGASVLLLARERAMRVVDAAMVPLYFAMVSYGGADEDLSRLQR